MSAPAIATTDLTKFYGSHRGIEGVNLRVEQGEVFGFLGPNGAGKTTLIRVLLDLLRATDGRAEIFDLDCRAASRRVRSMIGYLPGEFTLYENLSGRGLLRYLGGLGGSADMPRARQAGTIAGAIVVASYAFETLRVMSSTLRPFDEISLFAWQKSSLSLAGEIHAESALLLLGLVALLATAAALIFERRDLTN